MPVKTETSVIRTESQLAGFSESIQGARALDAAFTGVSESSKKITGSVIDVQAQIDRLDSKYDASIKTANELARVQGLIAASEEQGGANAEQNARVLSNALAAHEAALQKVMGASNDNTQATTRMAAASRQAAAATDEQVTATQRLINAWAGVEPLDTAANVAHAQAYAAAIDALAAKFDPLVAAEQAFSRTMGEAKTALMNNVINQLNYERALETSSAALKKAQAAARDYYTELNKASAATAAAAQQKINTQLFGAAPQRGDQAGLEARQADLNAFGQELENLRFKYAPLIAAEHEYKRAIDEAHLARRAELIDDEQLAVALKRLETGYRNTVSAIHGSGNAANTASKNFGLASHQIQNLGFQLNDLVVQIGSGGGIFRPLLQQGAQVQQILSMSEGGMGGVLSRVTAQLRAMGPAAVAAWGAAATATAAAVTAVGVAIKAQIDYREEILKTQRALTTGPGRMSGIQAGDIESAAEKASKTSQGLSTGDLRDVALEYARLGSIGKKVMSDLTGVTEAYAKTLGIDTAQAIKELGAAFADPAKGAAFLGERLRFLSGAQIEYIAVLARTEGRVSAQGQLLRDLAKGPLVDLKNEIVTVSGAWTAFWKNVEKGGDVIVRTVAKITAPKDLQQQLAAVEAQIAAIADAKAKAMESGTQGDLGGFGVESRGAFGGGADPDAERQKLFGEAARLRMQIEKQAQDAVEAGFLTMSQEADALVRHLDPIGTKFVELQKNAKLLEDALRMPDKLTNVDATKDALERLKVAMGGATTVAEAHVVALDRATQAHQTALAAIAAVTLEQQQAVAAEQARAAAEAAGALATEQATAAQRARETVLAQANATTAQQLAQGALMLQQIQVETQATLAQTDVERQAALVAQAKLAFLQAETAAIAAGRGEVNARMEAEMAYNQVMAAGNAQRVVRLQQAQQEIAEGARALAQQQLNIQSQNAYTAAQQRAAAMAQANAAAEEARNAAIRAGNTPKQAAIKAEQAWTMVMEEHNAKVDQAIAAANRQIQANNLQLRAINATTVAERAQIAAEQSLASTENSLMTMTQRLTIAEQERQKVLEQSEAALQQMITAQEGEIDLLQASISSINMEKSAREALLAGIRAENQLKQMGIDINSEMAQSYIRNAEAIARMSVELERAEAKQRAMNTAASNYRAPRLDSGTSWSEQMDDLNQALASKGGFQMRELPFVASMREEAEKNQAAIDERKKAANAPAASAGITESSRSKNFLDMFAEIAQNTANTTDAVKDVDLGDIGTEIGRLRDLQEAALSRVYKPDPYAEKNPEFFYNGEKIMKEGQDRIFDGLQTQIEKLQSLQASVGALVAQGAALPQALVDALIAAGFGNIASDIASAITAQSVPSVTPNPTATMWDSGSGVSTPASTSVFAPGTWASKGFTLTPEYLANLNQSANYTRMQAPRGFR